jgi:hypothetical protein
VPETVQAPSGANESSPAGTAGYKTRDQDQSRQGRLRQIAFFNREEQAKKSSVGGEKISFQHGLTTKED